MIFNVFVWDVSSVFSSYDKDHSEIFQLKSSMSSFLTRFQHHFVFLESTSRQSRLRSYDIYSTGRISVSTYIFQKTVENVMQWTNVVGPISIT